jgi:hypothetical protein
MASQAEIDEVKAKTDAIAAKVKSDPAYAAEFKKNPTGTLKAAGIPDSAVAELFHAKKDDVSGYGYYEYVYECVYYTNYYEYLWEYIY